MTRGRRRATGLLVLALLAGCTTEHQQPAPAPSAAPDSSRSPAPSLPLAAEAPVGGPSEHAPPFAILAAVDLSAGAPESASATAAVAGPEGSVIVLLTSPDPPARFELVTVDADHRVLRSVQVPRMRQVWGMHLLPGGEVAIGGWFQPEQFGYGFTVVDPVSGYVRTFRVIPYEDDTSTAVGHTAISPDGAVLYLFVGTTIGFRSTDLLFAVDATSGDFLAGRDLFEELRGLSERGIGRTAAGLLPRRDGGVTLAFAGLPPDEREDIAFPMLLGYDADLMPVGSWVSVEAGALGYTPSAAVGGRGTVFVAVTGQGGDWLLAARDPDGPATPVLSLLRRGFTFSFVVDPTERWMAMPGLDGVRAVDLATGDARAVPVGCAGGYPARILAPGNDGTVLALGACADGQDRLPMLWVLGG